MLISGLLYEKREKKRERKEKKNKRNDFLIFQHLRVPHRELNSASPSPAHEGTKRLDHSKGLVPKVHFFAWVLRANYSALAVAHLCTWDKSLTLQTNAAPLSHQVAMHVAFIMKWPLCLMPSS